MFIMFINTKAMKTLSHWQKHGAKFFHYFWTRP